MRAGPDNTVVRSLYRQDANAAHVLCPRIIPRESQHVGVRRPCHQARLIGPLHGADAAPIRNADLREEGGGRGGGGGS